MAISLRLDRHLEKRLEDAARLAGVSKSEFVRRCVQSALDAEGSRPSPYELAKDLIPPTGSGRGDLAQNAEQYLKEMLREKANRHRHRASGGSV